MSSIEEHIRKIKEHFEEIDDAIEEGIEKRPITIGFHCSACAIELLELYLHSLNKISMGKVLKHDWFKKPQEQQKKEPLIDKKLNIEFDNKDILYKLIYDIEENRNTLVYGKSGNDKVNKVLQIFIKYKEIILDLINKGGIKIE